MFRKHNLEADAFQEITEQELFDLSALFTTRLRPKLNGFEQIENLLFDKIFRSHQNKRGLYKEAQKRRTLQLLLLNYYHCFCNSVPLAIPLNSNFYTGSKHSYQDVTAIRVFLENAGGSQGILGNRFSGRCSVNWAIGFLADEFNKFQEDPSCALDYQPVQDLVVLKDKDKNRIKFKRNRITNQSEKILTQYNELITNQRIGISGLLEWSDRSTCSTNLLNYLYKYLIESINNNPISIHPLTNNQTLLLHYNRIWEGLSQKTSKTKQLATLNSVFYLLELMLFPAAHQLSRVFNNSTVNEGGRFYWTPIQNLSKDLRKAITINGQDTIELDYSCYHTSILYHKEGLDVPSAPYIYPHGSPLREIMKMLLNTAINIEESTGRGRNNTILSVLKEISFKKPDLKIALEASNYYRHAQSHYYALQKMYDELCAHHEPIQKAFSANEGMRLQRIDSDIAGEILRYFTERQIPIIPIHDSFIIQKTLAEDLRRTMKDVYFRKFNKQIEVK